MKQLITLALLGALAFTQTAKADGKLTAGHNDLAAKKSEQTLIWHQDKAVAYLQEKGIDINWIDAQKVLFFALAR